MSGEPLIRLEPGGKATVLSYNVPEPTSYTGRNLINSASRGAGSGAAAASAIIVALRADVAGSRSIREQAHETMATVTVNARCMLRQSMGALHLVVNEG